jgi:hypothetical protein
MDAPLPLVLDLLEWIGSWPRSYAEVMDVWRTSCPRLPVWEDAIDQGLVERDIRAGQPGRIVLTSAGEDFLRGHRGVRLGLGSR